MNFNFESSEHASSIMILPEIVTVAGYKPMNGECATLGDRPIYVSTECNNRSAIEDTYRLALFASKLPFTILFRVCIHLP